MGTHMTLKRFPMAILIALLAGAGVVPVFIAEGSLHIYNRAVPDSHAADYFASQYDASRQPVVLKADDGIQLQARLFRPAAFNGAAVLLPHGVGDTRLGRETRRGSGRASRRAQAASRGRVAGGADSFVVFASAVRAGCNASFAGRGAARGKDSGALDTWNCRREHTGVTVARVTSGES